MSEMEDKVLLATRRWLEEAVIGLNLCPFARREYERGRIHFALCEETETEALLLAFAGELLRLEQEPGIDTTLLVFSRALESFDDYLDLLDMAQAWLEEQGLEGVYQLASFHPDYVFADVAETDAGNCTNRSPWPILHLLREDSVAEAVAAHRDIAGIPERNITLARDKGMAYWDALLTRLREGAAR
ncbi:MAG: DUF1415 domain-containing protein [Pseudomonadales bacterium]|nr:DUF1415 domain-containing protein [Pseudomonadales bacterium]MCP5330636.1 DUF1415 domain-containing protein [Pseudomonadales bacterium]MCP5344266.1 DUF1415 domain-containing protein [Pseudomonadales bacterium]